MSRRNLSATLLTLWLWTTTVTGQTILFDKTGSMADIEAIQASLVESISNVSPIVDTFGLSIFSEHPLSSPVHMISVPRSVGTSRIEHVNQKHLAEARAEVRAQLERHLGSDKSSPAKKTNLPAVLLRADAEQKPTLVATDGNDETGMTSKRLGDGDGVHVVLCADKRDDPGKELELFQKRKTQVIAMLPKATVYACFQLRQAAQAWALAASGGGFSRISKKME